MIEIEKLKQILLNHEPIWCVGMGGNVFKIGNKKKDTERLLNYYVDKYSGNNYFESEQRANWYVNYGNVTKIEQISFPFWDDIEQDLAKSYGNYCLFDDKGFTVDYHIPSRDKHWQNKIVLTYFDNHTEELVTKRYNATADGYQECCDFIISKFMEK